MSRERALSELEEGGGSQFDPEVIEALLAVLADGELGGKPGRPILATDGSRDSRR